LVRQAAGQTEPIDAVRNFRVALVTMPFAPSAQPSIQIGLLKSIVERAGFHVDDYYVNLDLAAVLGVAAYEAMVIAVGTMVAFRGEWLFSVAAFGQEAGGDDFLSVFPGEAAPVADVAGIDEAGLNDLRNRVVPEFLNDCLERIDWGSYNVVGFTSAFHQNVASLALAGRIKQRFPHVTIVFGGANMEGEMGLEYVRAFPCIDYAVIGEGDVVFPELLTRLAKGCETDGMLGVASLRCGRVSFPGRPDLLQDLDSLPVPDYSAYYESIRRLGVDKDPAFLKLAHDLPFEGSRGCWWGMRSHCTFCGLNGQRMSYRSKSPERLIAELDELQSRHGEGKLFAVDAVLDLRYITEMFEPLSARDRRYTLFYTTKANLTREQIRLLARGGLSAMLPGIESLSTPTLKLMRKGVTKLQNVNVLRWGTYYNVNVIWNLLYGIPGERAEDYAEQLATFRSITHTYPPSQTMPIMLVRHSPNFEDPQVFATTRRGPAACYRYIYPDYVDLEKSAYIFEYEVTADTLPTDAYREAREFIATWNDLFWSDQRPSLTYRRVESGVFICDTRAGTNQPRTYTIAGLEAEIYEALSSAPRSPAQVCGMLRAGIPSLAPSEETVAGVCNDLCDAGLMIGEAGKYLSLAIPAEHEI
jgi:ribosomal peptide maturation radical SAM protein 1